ncbi:MAG: AbrB/MazE/SpoVT family DNA-binding domain-containing protein [Patescibacteria group bacterium]|nr:AbrB/MazE/SpoVT family DNA-binding domain-containing protein [Patescibacteria group bacterium]
MVTITKITSKGQITLPAKWRRNFSTNQYIIEEKKDRLEIKPLILKELYKKNEYTVFDAIRDNKGKGIKAKDLIKVLKKTV